MNNVLWTLYLADVVGSLSAVFSMTAVGAVLFAAVARGLTAIEDEPCPASVKPALIIAAICAATASVIPSKTTLYAIAAVQVGEKAIQTPTGDKAVRALNAWLDRQIADDNKETK